MTKAYLAHWLLSGRNTAAAPGATDFLGALAEAEKTASTPAGPGTAAVLLGIFWKLALVIALIVLTVWALRRILRVGGIPLSTPGAVRVLAVTHLDARRSVFIIEVGERVLIVGGGTESLNLLAEITSPVEKAQIRERLREVEGPGKFSSYLASWASRMTGAPGARAEMEGARDFLRTLTGKKRGGEGEGGKP